LEIHPKGCGEREILPCRTEGLSESPPLRVFNESTAFGWIVVHLVRFGPRAVVETNSRTQSSGALHRPILHLHQVFLRASTERTRLGDARDHLPRYHADHQEFRTGKAVGPYDGIVSRFHGFETLNKRRPIEGGVEVLVVDPRKKPQRVHCLTKVTEPASENHLVVPCHDQLVSVLLHLGVVLGTILGRVVTLGLEGLGTPVEGGRASNERARDKAFFV